MEPTELRRESLSRWGISGGFVLFGGPGIVGVYLPLAITHWRVADESRWLRGVAIALICLGLVPLVESVIRFIRVGRGTLVPTAPTRTLVISGFYRYVRNPMYVGVLALVAGQVLLFRSRDLALYLAGVALGFHLFVTAWEERKLRRTYGESYEEFCRNVPRWMPRMRPWTQSLLCL